MNLKVVKKAKSTSQAARFYATGKRKEAAARVWLSPGRGEIVINDKICTEYFPVQRLVAMIRKPFIVTNTLDRFDVKCTVKGSGLSGQAGAIHHGISRALDIADPSLHTVLSSNGLLTRDARRVERKKYGLRKARRRSQFSKR